MTKRYWDLQYSDGSHRCIWAEFADVPDSGAVVFVNVLDPTSQDPSKKFEHVYKVAPGTWKDILNITEGRPNTLPKPAHDEIGHPPADVQRHRRNVN